MALASELPDDLEVDDQDDAGDDAAPPGGLSFFAVAGDVGLSAEGIDERIATSIYGLYLKSSLAHGFVSDRNVTAEMKRARRSDARLEQERSRRRPLHLVVAAPPPAAHSPTTQEIDRMPKSSAEGLRAAVTRAHAEHVKRSGEPPSAKDLFGSLGEDVGKSISNVRMAAIRAGLELKKLRGADGAPPPHNVAPREAARPSEARARRAFAGGVVRGSRRVPRDPGAADAAREARRPARGDRHDDRIASQMNGGS